MEKSIIINEIKTYLKINNTKEFTSIPFERIFGNKYDYAELASFIQESIPFVDIEGKRYCIGVWNNSSSLFYLLSDSQ